MDKSRRTWTWALAALAVVAVVAIAIGSRSGESADASGAAQPVGMDSAAVRAEVAATGAKAPEAQRSAFNDGKITETEYRDGVSKALDCLADGIVGEQSPKAQHPDMMGPKLSADKFSYTYEYSVYDPALTEKSTDIEKGCQVRFYRSIEKAYHLQLRGDPAYVEGVTNGMNKCLDKAGVAAIQGGDDANVRERILATGQDRDRAVKTAQGVSSCLADYPSINDAN